MTKDAIGLMWATDKGMPNWVALGLKSPSFTSTSASALHFRRSRDARPGQMPNLSATAEFRSLLDNTDNVRRAKKTKERPRPRDSH